MSALILRVGSKHRLTENLRLGVWGEPKGNPSLIDDYVLTDVPKGTELAAGLTCLYGTGPHKKQAQWFTDGRGRWFVFILERDQTLLEPLDDYGPMGALVVDDPSGEDVCADA